MINILYMKKVVCFLIFFLFVCCINSTRIDNKDIVEDWIGKSVKFPESLKKENVINGSKDVKLVKCKGKIIVYVDSTGCLECKLSIPEWTLKIREMGILNPDIVFLFIINDTKYDVIKSILFKNKFCYPIYLDSGNCFYSENNLVDDSKYHVFLTDNKNKILLIGNPISNYKMWELYKEECRKL